MTQLHFPTLSHPDFAGKTRAGDIGDAMADVDHNVGLITGALKRLKLDDNTLVIWCTDNGAEGRRPWRGTSGVWRGFYNTVMEGGVRTPCVVRWTGAYRAGRRSTASCTRWTSSPRLQLRWAPTSSRRTGPSTA
ncbi:MAG: sulfatase-like hydrolase/transferase [Gemmatimonadetes bacterium]|nr:sulfatase-like hydrolase/transferase [Gemmatimonadota bacterium]